jgi:beta-glucosidase
MGWEIYPEGLTELLTGIHQRYPGLPPLYLMENGMANADVLEGGRVHDAQRIDYIRRHIDAIARAREAGVDIRGFFYWSLLDNYEWDSGYDKRFGIVHVDYATQQRTPKDSALWYRDTIAQAKGEAGHG